MVMEFINPKLSAGVIAKSRGRGDLRRNDGQVLQPARNNRWYVLATIAGEPDLRIAGEPYVREQRELDENLAIKNRRYWNGWACEGLAHNKRVELAVKMDLKVEDLMPLTKNEKSEVLIRFKEVFGARKKIPEQSEVIYLRNTYFEKPFNFSKYVILNTAIFDSAHFKRHANFRGTHFEGDAIFDKTHFESGVQFTDSHFETAGIFYNTHFERNAAFVMAYFNRLANFRETHFKGDTCFVAAHFECGASFDDVHFESGSEFTHAYFGSDADFSRACFEGDAKFYETQFERSAIFNSANFSSKTDFSLAKFKNFVPEFHATQLYDDTVFPTSDKMEGCWPRVPKINSKMVKLKRLEVMPAESQKRAYNRLRLFMNKSQQIDEEMFFQRREMGCKAEIESGLVRGLFKLYGGVSDYGSSILRPLAGLVLNLFIGWVGFLFYLNWAKDILEVNPIWMAFGVSFSNIFAFFGFGRLFLGETMKDLPDGMVFLAGLQTVFGFITLFLLGLGLRNRFRLR